MARRLTAAVLTLALACSLAACGGDDDAATQGTTTVAPGAGGAPDGEAAAPGDPPPDFAAQLDAARSELSSADTFCEVFAVVGRFETIAPTTADEMRLALDHFLALIRRLAATVPKDLSAEAAILRSSADAIEAEAAAGEYDPMTLNTLPTLTDPDFQAAQQAIFAASSAC